MSLKYISKKNLVGLQCVTKQHSMIYLYIYIYCCLYSWEYMKYDTMLSVSTAGKPRCAGMDFCMMKSSNGNIFRLTGPLCGEFPGEFPTQRLVTRSFDVSFGLPLNKRLSKQSRGWWFETLSCPFWRHCNGIPNISASDHTRMQTREARDIRVQQSNLSGWSIGWGYPWLKRQWK